MESQVWHDATTPRAVHAVRALRWDAAVGHGTGQPQAPGPADLEYSLGANLET